MAYVLLTAIRLASVGGGSGLRPLSGKATLSKGKAERHTAYVKRGVLRRIPAHWTAVPCEQDATDSDPPVTHPTI